MLLQVEDFIFPMDFIILHMEGVDTYHQTPIILGSPFLTTTNTCINCCIEIMDISFENKRVWLNVFTTVMGPTSDKFISFAKGEEVEGRNLESFASISSIAGPFLTHVNYITICTSSIYSLLGEK